MIVVRLLSQRVYISLVSTGLNRGEPGDEYENVTA